jgi:peptidyl-prolyl cis-trans isomerase C
MSFPAVTSARAAVRLLAASAVALPLLASGVLAQGTSAESTPAGGPPTQSSAASTTPPDAAPGGANDPVVAKVNGQPIYSSDVRDAAASLPPSARNMSPQQLFPMLLDQLIDGQALIAEARKTGLDKNPIVQRQVQDASDRALETALLHQQIGPLVTEDAVRARYDQDIAAKPPEVEVHARHILVADEATAKKIIAELKKGADFAALSKQYSTDPGAKQQNGDLGFFKKDEMVPEFADAAFALKDGEVSPEPVHSQFGWHVIQVIERRQAPPVPFEQARDELRQQMIQENVQKVVGKARAGVTVEKFNMNGSVPRATDLAEPPAGK